MTTAVANKTTFIAERMLSGLMFEVNPEDYASISVKGAYETGYVLRLTGHDGKTEDVFTEELPVGVWFVKE